MSDTDNIKMAFSSVEVEMSDGHNYWNVVVCCADSLKQAVVASFSNEDAALECEMALNLALTDACESAKSAFLNCSGDA